MNRESTEGFKGNEVTLCDTIMVGTCHHTFTQPTECTKPRMNPNGNCGLWVGVMSPCWFLHCNKCTAVIGDVDNGGGCAHVEAGADEKSLYLLLNAAMNLKLL